MRDLVILPIVLPLATAALMLLVEERRHALKAAISLAGALGTLAVAAMLLARAEAPVPHVYPLGNWPAPFGIVLVADRLSALLVLLGAVLGLAAIVFSLARWHRTGPHFHTLAHVLLAGMNGAFLTGDLFNLFVFFELLLAASYGLALYGGGAARVRASLHYIVVNLAASLLFLIGAALMYGVTGTLNMADLALRVPALAGPERALVEIAAGALGAVFLVKAAMWPLGFWLPGAYAAAAAPSAALFAILSKVGVYAVLRLWLLVFGDGAGAEVLAYGGMATVAFGILGMLAAPDLPRACSYSLVVSSGTLLAATGLGGAALAGPVLYYLVVSTLGVGAFFLLVELVERSREPGADVLAVTAEAFGLADDKPEPEEEEVGVAIPATMAMLGIAFACAALLVAGLPPLPGFVAKFAILSSLLGAGGAPGPAAWTLLALLLASGLAAVIAFGRAGIRVFWPSRERTIPRVRVVEMAPVALLLGLCLALTVAAEPAMRYARDAAQVLAAPRSYIEEVLPRR